MLSEISPWSKLYQISVVDGFLARGSFFIYVFIMRGPVWSWPFLYAKYLCTFLSLYEQAVEQTIELLLIWDTMMVICYCSKAKHRQWEGMWYYHTYSPCGQLWQWEHIFVCKNNIHEALDIKIVVVQRIYARCPFIILSLVLLITMSVIIKCCTKITICIKCMLPLSRELSGSGVYNENDKPLCSLHLAAHIIKYQSPHNWPFVRGIHRWQVNFPHTKVQ